MNMIAIESSTQICSVSSFMDGQLVNVFETDKPMSHSKNLPIMLKAAIEDFNTIKDINSFSISIGPGSFTSLRISMSLVKGIAFSLKANILPVPTLESINYQVEDSNLHYVILDCYKDKCFVQEFKDSSSYSEPYIESIKNLSKIESSSFYGYSEKVKNGEFEINIIKPSSISVGNFAINNVDRLLPSINKDIKPIYLSEHEYVKINDSKSRK